MFTPSCDAPDCYEAADWGEWTSAYAWERAREEGWHRSGSNMLCAGCWSSGVRFAHL